MKGRVEWAFFKWYTRGITKQEGRKMAEAAKEARNLALDPEDMGYS